jgi:biopolymer transport protein ExbD
VAMQTQDGGSGLTSSEDPSESAPIIAEINITPLTDVFLVLLIIFMVTSSVMSQTGMDVDLPKASQQITQAVPEGVVLTVMPDGGIKVNGESIAGAAGTSERWESMESKLRSAFAVSKSKLLVLEGDKNVLLGSAIELMDHARKAGAESFAIATQGQ